VSVRVRSCVGSLCCVVVVVVVGRRRRRRHRWSSLVVVVLLWCCCWSSLCCCVVVLLVVVVVVLVCSCVRSLVRSSLFSVRLFVVVHGACRKVVKVHTVHSCRCCCCCSLVVLGRSFVRSLVDFLSFFALSRSLVDFVVVVDGVLCCSVGHAVLSRSLSSSPFVVVCCCCCSLLLPPLTVCGEVCHR